MSEHTHEWVEWEKLGVKNGGRYCKICDIEETPKRKLFTMHYEEPDCKPGHVHEWEEVSPADSHGIKEYVCRWCDAEHAGKCRPDEEGDEETPVSALAGSEDTPTVLVDAELTALRQRVAELEAQEIEVDKARLLVLNALSEDNDALREKVARMKTALTEIHEANPLHNDWEAYLYELEKWGLGEIEERPNPQSYGLPALKALADAGAGEGK